MDVGEKKMDRKTYICPMLEITVLEGVDIITSSERYNDLLFDLDFEYEEED